jgi:hypothetical protein
MFDGMVLERQKDGTWRWANVDGSWGWVDYSKQKDGKPEQIGFYVARYEHVPVQAPKSAGEKGAQ